MAAAQWSVRALVRDTTTPPSIALHDAGAELVRGSFADIDVIRTAMKDTHGVFSVLPGGLDRDEEVRLGTAIADLAAESGVAHFVYSSGASVGDTPTGVARFDAKGDVEAHVRALPLAATIVRPVIFMEMMVAPGFRLDEGRYTFLLRPNQSMQLLAVEDIGKFVAAIFADRKRFDGETLRIASDTVTGRDLEAFFSEAAGRPIAYARFSDEALAAHAGFGPLAASLDGGPLADHIGLDAMRAIHPGIIPFRSWLAGRGHEVLAAALRGEAIGQR